MNKYRINYPIKIGRQKLKILSYNIYYKAMLGLNDNFLPQELAQGNVKNIIKSGDYDIIGLQEVECINKIFDPQVLNKYSYVSGKSGKETITTFFKNRYQLIKEKTTDFHKGRPIQLLLLEESDNIILVLNLHAPHDTNDFRKYNGKVNKSNYHYSLELIRIINEEINIFINENIIFTNFIIDRIILIGDFNELYDNPIDNKYSFDIIINGVNYLLKTDSNKIKSCCYPNIHKPGDYIFDSKTEPKLKIVDTIHPASDHYPVDTILN